MSTLSLREIGASNPEEQAVLELFASFREHVLHVSASHLLSDQIAVTTKNGFIELIDTATGEFRLFLTYLDQIPLDASLRCFSLVPSLYTTTAFTSLTAPSTVAGHGAVSTLTKRQPHLLYSLAYSNELLLAQVESGAVVALAACASRPSVVECDADYIACGEGNGQVSMWRGSAEARDRVRVTTSAGTTALLPPLLWQRKLFEDTVVCLGLHRDQLVCCGADFGCVVVAVEDGTVRASLSPTSSPSFGLERGVAALALTHAAGSQEKVLALCLTSHIAVYAASRVRSEGDETATVGAVPPTSILSSSPSPQHAERWTYCGGCAVGEGEEVTCASCLGGYLAAGTQSGFVLLYACDAARRQVSEVVRFNVGYGVRGTQLFPDDTLLVVTSAGDVWRWPLCDLLATAAESHEEAGAEARGGSGGAAEKQENARQVGEAADSAEEDEDPMPKMESPPTPVAAPELKTASHSVLPNISPQGVESGALKDEAVQRRVSLHDASFPTTQDDAAVLAAEAAKVAAAAHSATPDKETKPAAHVTSVHLSPLHQHDEADLVVSTEEDNDDDDDDEGGDGHARKHNCSGSDGAKRKTESLQQQRDDDVDRFDTDAPSAEPTTTFSPAAPPAEPRSITRSPAEGVNTTVDKLSPLTQGKTRAALYDPENAPCDDSPDRKGETTALTDRSAEVSHGGSTGGVSPPSSVDTTAHIEVSSTAEAERMRRSETTPPSRRHLGSATRSAHDQRASRNGTPSPTHNSPLHDSATFDPQRKSSGESDKRTTSHANDSTNRLTKEEEEMAQLEAEFDQAVARMLGPKVSLDGLRRGRRMDPRKVAGVLQNLANQRAHAAENMEDNKGSSSSNTTATPPAPLLTGLNSTQLLEEKRAALDAAAFDFDAFRQTHRLAVDALPFQHPVKALTYSPQDRAFASVEATTTAAARICGGESAAAVTKGAGALPASQDELRDVTYGRVRRVMDPEMAEERRRGGPALMQHHCDDLLYLTDSVESTILFQEDVLQPSTAWEEVLLLPMPLPPASSVF